MQTGAAHNPAHMRPPSAVVGSVRVAGTVGDLVMNSVCCNPEHRPAFKRERSADRKKVFNPLGRGVATMGQQAVVAHSDAHIDGKDIQNCGDSNRFP